MAKKITINIKFYSGIDQEIGLTGYNPHHGLDLEVPAHSRLNSALKSLGYKKRSYHAVFCNGERASLRLKVEDGDQISLIIPSAGG